MDGWRADERKGEQDFLRCRETKDKGVRVGKTLSSFDFECLRAVPKRVHGVKYI